MAGLDGCSGTSWDRSHAEPCKFISRQEASRLEALLHFVPSGTTERGFGPRSKEGCPQLAASLYSGLITFLPFLWRKVAEPD